MTRSGSSDVVAFRRALRRAGPELRRSLPWIDHLDPWAILVSEVMLQQTQSPRVIEPWSRFLARFPTPTSCADAPLSDVLRCWSGLGFPRRARALHTAARQMVNEHGGAVPTTYEQLLQLAGVGEYTASAVASFAFHLPRAVVDTNVGRVLARAIANRSLSAKEARETALAVLPGGDSSPFNQAMMDLGAQYCRSMPACAECPMKRVCRWYIEGGVDPAPGSAGVSKRQSKFSGSNRQLRGRILREVQDDPVPRDQLRAIFYEIDEPRFIWVLESLERDGLVEAGDLVRLTGD